MFDHKHLLTLWLNQNHIITTEEIIDLTTNSMRNDLIALDLRIALMSVGVGTGALVAGECPKHYSSTGKPFSDSCFKSSDFRNELEVRHGDCPICLPRCTHCLRLCVYEWVCVWMFCPQHGYQGLVRQSSSLSTWW